MTLFQPMRTDRRLWLICTAVVFVALGFVSLHTRAVEGKIGPSYFWGMVVALPQVTEWWRALSVLAICAAVIAIPAAVLGWVLHAVTVLGRSVLTKQPGTPAI